MRATSVRTAEESGADELMVQDLVARSATRRRSHRLLAGAFGPSPR